MLLTSDNLFVRDHFVEGQDLLLFQFDRIEGVNDLINHYLSKEQDRVRIVENGRRKVMASHTWDHRAETIVERLKYYQRKI